MKATNSRKIMHSMICVTNVYSRAMINASVWACRKFTIWIYSDPINVINVKHDADADCAVPVYATFSDLNHISRAHCVK